MQGVTGPISVTGVQFRLEMPGLPDLNDKQIAAVLTYIRRVGAWGRTGGGGVCGEGEGRGKGEEPAMDGDLSY